MAKPRHMEGQISLFSMLEPEPATDKLFDVGDKVYRVLFDIVEERTVTDTFECADHEGGRTVRYHSSGQDGGNRCFGKYEVGHTFFASREEAEAAATENLGSGAFQVVRANEIEAVEFTAWEEPASTMGRSRPLYAVRALVKLGGAWAVYRKAPVTYHFMDRYPSEQEARKAYGKSAREYVDRDVRNMPECGSFRPVDLYGRGDGHWAQAEYANNNWFGGLIR